MKHHQEPMARAPMILAVISVISLITIAVVNANLFVEAGSSHPLRIAFACGLSIIFIWFMHSTYKKVEKGESGSLDTRRVLLALLFLPAIGIIHYATDTSHLLLRFHIDNKMADYDTEQFLMPHVSDYAVFLLNRDFIAQARGTQLPLVYAKKERSLLADLDIEGQEDGSLQVTLTNVADHACRGFVRAFEETYAMPVLDIEGGFRSALATVSTAQLEVNGRELQSQDGRLLLMDLADVCHSSSEIQSSEIKVRFALEF